MKLAVFDICGTLYYDNTTYSFLRWLSKKNIIKYNKNIMNAPYILRALNVIYSSFTGKDVYRILQVKQLSDFSLEDINKWASEFVDELEENRIYSTNVLMGEYKKQGYEIVIASATIEPVARAIAHKLGVEYYSSKIGFLNNKCTGEIKKDLLLLKKDTLLPLLKTAETTIVVTDNYTDIELVLVSDHSHIIVRNDRDIEKWNRCLKANARKVDFIKKDA
ncbi:HAD family hydrolase [Citrobacter portucalensis]|uniref:HAD-IB family phosphatase n=1 Tax=Citrobacter portucalensis TaxID=1639133 RepID=A0A9X4GR41_9ENTR|nr:HAD-IB family phosphatase [Citrobacter portucalensis]MDE9621218.1 HAD-IB family phosphatase [Citrobacter portucalensis]MEB0900365.1 HAD-IB family phosphatase [Citrobacter portucalensis]